MGRGEKKKLATTKKGPNDASGRVVWALGKFFSPLSLCFFVTNQIYLGVLTYILPHAHSGATHTHHLTPPSLEM